METMKAFWRYDWRRNAPRHLALTVMMAVWPWAVAVGRSGMESGRLWAPVLIAVGGALVVAIPLLFVGNVVEVGRAASPRENRHFAHVLPIDRKVWALAKLAGAGIWALALPVALLAANGIAFHLLQMGNLGHSIVGDFAKAAEFLHFLSMLSAFTVWTMLGAALLPHRWVLVGVPVFVLGEALVRGITSMADLQTSVQWTLLARGFDMGLLLVLAGLLAVVFVLYHERRRRGWALAAMLLAFASVDGVRALVWWLVRTI